MQLRSWLIFGFVALAVLLLVIEMIQTMQIKRSIRKLEARGLVRDDNARAEAKIAHQRIDRLDGDVAGNYNDIGTLRAIINAIKGQVSFIMHKDISEEIAKQAAAEKKKTDDDAAHKN